MELGTKFLHEPLSLQNNRKTAGGRKDGNSCTFGTYQRSVPVCRLARHVGTGRNEKDCNLLRTAPPPGSIGDTPRRIKKRETASTYIAPVQFTNFSNLIYGSQREQYQRAWLRFEDTRRNTPVWGDAVGRLQERPYLGGGPRMLCKRPRAILFKGPCRPRSHPPAPSTKTKQKLS